MRTWHVIGTIFLVLICARYAGAVIDTVNQPHIALAPGSFKIGPGEPAVKTMTLCNTGIRDTLQYTFSSAGSGTANILAWTYGADLSSSWPATMSSIRGLMPAANITTTTTTDPATLAVLLQGADVFLIPSQEYTTPSSSIGTAFAPVLDTYVRSGGTVVVLFPNYIPTFLSYAGLDTLGSTYSYTTSSYTVTINNSSHPVFDSVSQSSLVTLYRTGYWTKLSSSTTLATYSSYAVCTEKIKGNGAIYLLGYDFYSTNTTTWGRMLFNCINRNSSGGRVTADTASGWVKAGACKNVILNFHREGLQPGASIFRLSIRHNALLEQNPVLVPCTLMVDSTTLAYQVPGMSATIHTGDTAVKRVTLQNTGSSLLNFGVVKTSKSDAAASILINEVSTYNLFIELINTGSSDVNIGGYRLVWTDNNGTSGSYMFPSNATIRSHRFVVGCGYSGTTNDTAFYFGSYVGWGSSTEFSVSLLNASGQGVDFFKTSVDQTNPPAGTSWSGTGFWRSGSVYDYYRMSIVDNNTAADWAGSSFSSSYTWLQLNP
jgi:hypothetical protein